jgi:hypothetical protein
MGDGPAPAGIAANLDPGTRFVRAPNLLWRQSAGVILARTVADAEIVEVSGTGLLLWLALLEPVSADDLTGELAAVLGVPDEVLARDVRTALADLVHRGLVTQLGPAG